MRGLAMCAVLLSHLGDNLSIAADALVTPNLLCSGMYPGEMEGSRGRCLSIRPDVGLQCS